MFFAAQFCKGAYKQTKIVGKDHSARRIHSALLTTIARRGIKSSSNDVTLLFLQGHCAGGR